jgi:hypothetical protein
MDKVCLLDRASAKVYLFVVVVWCLMDFVQVATPVRSWTPGSKECMVIPACLTGTPRPSLALRPCRCRPSGTSAWLEDPSRPLKLQLRLGASLKK